MLPPVDRRFSRLDIVFCSIAVVVAAITRLTYLDLAEFKDDEARALGIAAAFLEGQLIPLIGIVSSVGINNPPAFEYLLAIPLLVSRDPAVATGFVGLLGVGAVLITYRVCLQYFDRTTAVVAALLFASSPWAIIFSRKLQAQDVVPFFVILWIGSLLGFASGKGARHLIGVAIWLNILLQLHLASVALIPITGIVVAVAAWRQRSDPRLRLAAAEAVGLTVLLWLPFLVFQITNRLADVHAFLKVIRQPPTVELESFKLVYEMVYLDAYNGMTGDGFPLFQSETINFDPLYNVERILFVGAAIWLVGRLAWSHGRAATDWRDGILLLWLILPPLFFVRHSTPIYPHYFLTVFPAQFIIIGRLFSGVAGLLQRWPIVLKVAGAAGATLIAALVLGQVAGLIQLMDFVGRESTLGSHGVPLRERQAAVDRAIAASVGTNKPVYVASYGQDYPASFEYLAHNRISLKVFDDRNTFVVPADDGTPTIYLATNPSQPAAQLLQQRFGEDLISTVPFPGMKIGFTMYRLPADAGARVLHPPALRPIAGTVPNGIHLEGYEADRQVQAGSTTRLALYWQVTGNPPVGEDYAFFSHLIDDTGHVYSQLDGLGYPPTFWRLGDSVVSWFDLAVGGDLPAKVGRIETGMYRRSDIGRLPITLSTGATVDRLLLGPIRLLPASPASAASPTIDQHVRFGSSIDLLGYELSELDPSTNAQTLTLVWRANSSPPADYTTFVHLVDAAGGIVAQSDGQPGPYPTSLWVAGDTFRDERVLDLAKPPPTGAYRLVVGLYRQDTQARLQSDVGDQVYLTSTVVVK